MSAVQPFDISKILNLADLPVHLKKIENGLMAATRTNNPALQEPLSRLVRAGSKRLRSSLVIAATDSLNAKIDETVISGCVAIELVHIGSLVHDDIIDNADTRWGIATVNSREGVNQAILVGDFLFARAGVTAASINAQAASLISSTIAALVDGESREVAEEFNTNRSLDSLFNSMRGKTAALVSAASQMGGICAGATKSEQAALARYGEAFGTAFQIIDDVLDFLSSEKLMGKPVGNDVKEGVYTLPLLLALKGHNGEKIRNILDKKEVDNSRLIKLIETSDGFRAALGEAKKYNLKASNAVANFGNPEGLSGLPDAYLNWATNNLIQSK